jgi:hypothetical protein
MSAKENIGSITKKTPLEIAAYIEQINTINYLDNHPTISHFLPDYSCQYEML